MDWLVFIASSIQLFVDFAFYYLYYVAGVAILKVFPILKTKYLITKHSKKHTTKIKIKVCISSRSAILASNNTGDN